MKIKNLIVILIILLTIVVAKAEEGHHTLGLQGGQVTLSGDVASAYGNALGIGLFYDYAASDWLELELGFLTDKHTNNNLTLTQNSYILSALYNIDQFDMLVPYLRGGAEVVTHTQDIPNPITATSFSSNAFGLNIGGGANFLFSDQFQAGLDLTYHSMFDSSVTLANGQSVKAIQSYTTILLRFGYHFDGGKKPGKTF